MRSSNTEPTLWGWSRTAGLTKCGYIWSAEAYSFNRVIIFKIIDQVDNLKVIKRNADIIASYLLDLFNQSFDGNFFPDEIKDRAINALFKNIVSFYRKTIDH